MKLWLTERAKMKPEMDAFFISERRTPLSRKTAWVAIRAYGRQDYPLKTIPTCCGIRVAWPWPTKAQTHGSSRLSGSEEYAAYGHVHGNQSGKVREIVALASNLWVIHTQMHFVACLVGVPCI